MSFISYRTRIKFNELYFSPICRKLYRSTTLLRKNRWSWCDVLKIYKQFLQLHQMWPTKTNYVWKVIFLWKHTVCIWYIYLHYFYNGSTPFKNIELIYLYYIPFWRENLRVILKYLRVNSIKYSLYSEFHWLY